MTQRVIDSITPWCWCGKRGIYSVIQSVRGSKIPDWWLMSFFRPFRSFLVVSAVSFQKLPVGYSLLINPSSLFNVRQETGEISLTRSLDYESDQRRYLLMVRASEEPGSLSTVTEVRRTDGRTDRQTRALLSFRLTGQPSTKMRSRLSLFIIRRCHTSFYS